MVAVVVHANRSLTTVYNFDRRVGLGPISNFGNVHLFGEASDFCSQHGVALSHQVGD